MGAATTLGLQPGCGLTLVVGRNGSGKSSFAEAAELTMTGSSQRWAEKSKIWRDGWRNVHHGGVRRISLRLRVDGEEGFTRVESRWAEGDDLEDRTEVAQATGGPEGPLDALALGSALETWRPFLSYDDLGSLLDAKPSEIHDRLSVLLGLEDWVEVENRLKAATKDITAVAKAADLRAKTIRSMLEGVDDQRAKQALAALPMRGGAWDLDVLEALATGTATQDPDLAQLNALAELTAPDANQVNAIADALVAAAEEVRRYAGTDAASDLQLAALLESAIAFHRDHRDHPTCPVCGTAEVLTDDWIADAAGKVALLNASSQAVADAGRALSKAVADGVAVLVPAPAVVASPPGSVDTNDLSEAWDAWALFLADGKPGDPEQAVGLADHLRATFPALASALAAVTTAAAHERDRRQDLWRPVAEEIGGWLDGARHTQTHRPTAKALKSATTWIAAESVRVRTERFEPIAEQVKAVWQQLRHDSNVNIDDLSLDGRATTRRLDLTVSVDDTAAAGMSVLSQGELHALSLALFLPRATQDDSPFRFVLIDDPVQAFDAARVDGLARVLQSVAQTRQVVVFTHDERLPDACRRIAIDARVLEVSRGERSALIIRSLSNPSERYLDDARAIALSDPYPIEARRRVVPGLCRQALEAASVDLGRRKLFERGLPFREIEARVSQLSTLVSHLAFGLFGDGGKGGEVYGRLSGLDRQGQPVDLVKQLNKGTHELVEHDPMGVVKQTATLVRIIEDNA